MPENSAPGAQASPVFDVIVIGGGICGVIALYYARKAGLDAVLLEKQATVGGLWAQLPPWQDIQFGRADWTLGDLPLAGEDQASIRDNIQAWVDRFDLADGIRLGTEVTSARRAADAWHVETPHGTLRARHLIAATGAHNRPRLPDPLRHDVTLAELHSSALRDPAQALAGRDVVVVGGGASAYDLLDLCLEHGARRIVWVYRQAHWMIPTRKTKAQAGGPRELAKAQMLGTSDAEISRGLHQDLLLRYSKFGLDDILPDEPFELGRHQLIPGRERMIRNFARIERHRSEVVRIEGRRIVLGSGATIEADLVLWGTGYEVDLRFFADPALSGIRQLPALLDQCGDGIRASAEPNLYFMGAWLDGTGATPWGACLIARTVIAHIRGQATLGTEPLRCKVNHFRCAHLLAAADPVNFPPGRWEAEFLKLALELPDGQPLPIPA